MATYKIVNPGMGWPAVTQTGTYATSAGVFPPLQFGQRVFAVDSSFGNGIFVFAYGSDVTAGNLVQFVGVGGGVRVAGSGTASAGPLGFAPAAMSNTNVWGFVQVQGVFDSATVSAAAAEGVAFKMGNAGALASRNATNVTNQLLGIYNASSNSASTPASVFLNFPSYAGY